MDLFIRKMVREDIEQVQAVARESWHATYEGIIPLTVQNNFLDNAYSDTMMERRLAHSLVFVAEVGDQLVGFANYAKANDQGKVELAAIYISPENQGIGIGTALLKAGIEEIKGIERIWIDVVKENTIGRNFYKAKGFQIVKEFEDDFDGHLLQTIRMRLTI